MLLCTHTMLLSDLGITLICICSTHNHWNKSNPPWKPARRMSSGWLAATTKNLPICLSDLFLFSDIILDCYFFFNPRPSSLLLKHLFISTTHIDFLFRFLLPLPNCSSVHSFDFYAFRHWQESQLLLALTLRDWETRRNVMVALWKHQSLWVDISMLIILTWA